MIDFTTIQTFEVLPELSALNGENIALKKSNLVLNTILCSVGIVAIIAGIYYINKKREEE